MARSEKITFTGADGESQLAARLDLPAGPAKAYALFAHCFTCTQDVFAAARIADGLTRHGIAVLRFDFTGLGASEGDFANTNFSSNVGDLRAAARWLRDNRAAPKILIGHSLGGAAVLAAAGDIDECVAVATIGAPAEPAHVRHLLQSAEAEIEAQLETNGEAEVKIVGRPFRIKKQFLEDIAEHRLADRIKGLKRALIVFHAPRDTIVGIDNASKIFLAAKHPKSFVSLDVADHLLSRREDAIYVAGMIAAWAERYLPAMPEEVPVIQAPEGAVTVAEAGLGRYTQTVSVGGRHVLYADEPPGVGGDDLGPSPYDLLLAGLGACTAMTMRMYAEHKKLPLERAAVTLRHEKIHAQDCAHCDTADGKVDRIAREITLEGPLDEAARVKLLEIADKCPVHRTLHSEVWVDTKLKD